MPEISRFYGIVIRMFTNDHAPPHFHASYAGVEAAFLIAGGRPKGDNFPLRQRNMVTSWALLRHDELMENWERIRRGEPPLRIAPRR